MAHSGPDPPAAVVDDRTRNGDVNIIIAAGVPVVVVVVVIVLVCW